MKEKKSLLHDEAAEQAVLGGLMLDNQAWDKVSEILTTDDFYHPRHRIIYSAYEQLRHQYHPLDTLTVTVKLNEQNMLDEIGGEITLYELVQKTPSAANIVHHAQIVHERSIRRQLHKISNLAVAESMSSSETVTDIIENFSSQIFKLQQIKTEKVGKHINTSFKEAVEFIDNAIQSGSNIYGLATGYHEIDDATCGLQKSELTIIAARPSMGKTAFALSIIQNVIDQNKSVLFFSSEMPARDISLRMFSSYSGLDMQLLRKGTAYRWPEKAEMFAAYMANKEYFIYDQQAISPDYVRKETRKWMAEHKKKIDLIVIDYLQLMQIKRYANNTNGRYTEVSEITTTLKNIAVELDIPIVALAQLSRSVDSRADKRPMMSDLKESGSIEQAADLIMMLYRDEVYNKESLDKGVAEVNIVKQRNGPIGSFKLAFRKSLVKFENY